MSSFDSLNKVILLGRLGKDPEVKYSQSGTAVCTFSMATSESVKKGDEFEDATTWHKIVCFGKLAENCGKFIKKGSKILLEGRIQNREYTDKEEVKRYISEVVTNDIKFLDPKGE